MYNAVRNGEYILLQDLLDKKNADINMLWVSIIFFNHISIVYLIFGKIACGLLINFF